LLIAQEISRVVPRDHAPTIILVHSVISLADFARDSRVSAVATIISDART
jgi:hypothetical protein